MNNQNQNPQVVSSRQTSKKKQNLSNSQQEIKSPKGSESTEKKTVLKKKPKHHSNNPKGRPVVNYDSSSKTLVFKKQYIVDGNVTWTQGVSVSLQEFDEATRQFIIALAKQAISFANGHEMVLAHLKRSKDAKTTEEKAVADKEKVDTVKTDETNSEASSTKNVTTDKTE